MITHTYGDPVWWYGAMTESTIDDVLYVLSDPRRREVIEYLQATDQAAVPFESIVSAVADGSRDEHRLALSLHHAHLPAMEAAGFVEYDQSAGDVRYNPDPRVEWLLSEVDRGAVSG